MPQQAAMKPEANVASHEPRDGRESPGQELDTNRAAAATRRPGQIQAGYSAETPEVPLAASASGSEKPVGVSICEPLVPCPLLVIDVLVIRTSRSAIRVRSSRWYEFKRWR
eukprot:scaffold219610_cov37-Tisochrysis_lutea.AAC.1